MNKTILMTGAVVAGTVFASSALAQQSAKHGLQSILYALRIQQTETIFSGSTAPSRSEIERQRRFEQRTRVREKILENVYCSNKKTKFRWLIILNPDISKGELQ